MLREEGGREGNGRRGRDGEEGSESGNGEAQKREEEK